MWMAMDGGEMCSELEPRGVSMNIIKDCEQRARRLSACAPRDRRSSVRQRRHWCCACPACCTRRSSFPCL